MDNLIDRILEIDENAKKKLEEACRRKSEILCDASRQEEEIREDVFKRVHGRVEKVEEYEKSNADEKIDEIKTQAAKTIELLDTKYAENHVSWENEIYNNILSRSN